MRNSKFVAADKDRDSKTHLFPVDVRIFHHSAMTPDMYDKRFKFQYLNRFVAKNIEQCARYGFDIITSFKSQAVLFLDCAF